MKYKINPRNQIAKVPETGLVVELNDIGEILSHINTSGEYIKQFDPTVDNLGDTTPALSDVLTFDEEDLTAPVAIDMDVTAGEVWEILDIVADLQADANAADRDLSVSVNPVKGVATPGPQVMWVSQLVRVTANQFGSIWLGKGGGAGYYHVNDNSAQAISTILDNPLPILLDGTGQVQAVVAAGAATDGLTMRVQYRRVA